MPHELKSSQIMFIPSNVLIRNAALFWRWRYEDCTLKGPPENAAWAQEAVSLLEKASGGMKAADFWDGLETIFKDKTLTAWRYLRRRGLALF
jgi:hypothetical protein